MSKPESILTDAEMHALICGNPSTLGLSIARLKDFIRQVEKAVVAKLVAEQAPVMYARTYNGEIDWDEGCVSKENDGALLSGFDYVDDVVALEHGYAVIPLYAHPMPCVSPTSDKTACVSEKAESETQADCDHLWEYKGLWADASTDGPAFHIHACSKCRKSRSTGDKESSSQVNLGSSESCEENSGLELARYQPCGCIVCYCENQERCLGCGAKHCGTHNLREMPNPVYVDHIAGASKMVERADEALLKELDLVGLDISAYSNPKEALAALIDWHASVAIDPRANGGWQLVPVEPTYDMTQAGVKLALSARISGAYPWPIYIRDMYKAMLAAEPKYTGGSNE